MNEAIGTVMKSGFPFLIFTFLAIMLVNLWRREDLTRDQRWQGTGILIVPVIVTVIVYAAIGQGPEALLTGVITGRQPFIPPWPELPYLLVSMGLFFLPFAGIFIWLLRSR